MAKWKKPRCSVCGKTLDTHPVKPCRRPISPGNIERMAYFDSLIERAQKRRQLNTSTSKRKGSVYIKQLNTAKDSSKKKRSRPTLTRAKRSLRTKRAQRKKKRLYN